MKYSEFHGFPDERYAEYSDVADGYNRGLVSEDALFDPYYIEESLLDHFNVRSDWDDELDRKIETINPNISFKSKEEWDFLASILHKGREAELDLEAGSPWLSEEEKARLEALVRDGRLAHEELFESQLRLASWFTRESMGLHKTQNENNGKKPVVSRYMKKGKVHDYASADLSYADRFQAVAMGLYKAVEMHDSDRGSFKTIAVYYMEGALIRQIKSASERYITHLPENAHTVISNISRELDECEMERRIPNAHDLSYVASLPIDQNSPNEKALTVEKMTEVMVTLPNISLDEIISTFAPESPLNEVEETQVLNVEDVVGANNAHEIEELERSHAIIQLLESGLAELSEREQMILEMHYGLGGLEPLNYTSIAKIFGRSVTRISQIEKNALKKLRCSESLRLTSGTRDLLAAIESDEQTHVRPNVVHVDESMICKLGLRDTICLDYSTSGMRHGSDKKKFTYREDWADQY